MLSPPVLSANTKVALRCRKPRRSKVATLSSHLLRIGHRVRGLTCRAQNRHVRTAATLQSRECFAQFLITQIRIAFESRHQGHHPTIGAVTTLRRFPCDEGLLHRMFTTQSVERANLGRLGDGGKGKDAGAHRIAIDDDGAGAALRETTAELRALACKFTTQCVEQRLVGVGFHFLPFAIDVEYVTRHGSPPVEESAEHSVWHSRAGQGTRNVHYDACAPYASGWRGVLRSVSVAQQ